MSKELAKTYDPKGLEERLYQKWLDNKYFHAEVNRDKKPFTIVMPPPNVTGQLHMGHPALKSVLNTNLKTSAEFRFGTCFVFASQCPIYLSLCRTTKLRSSKSLRMHKN